MEKKTLIEVTRAEYENIRAMFDKHQMLCDFYSKLFNAVPCNYGVLFGSEDSIVTASSNCEDPAELEIVKAFAEKMFAYHKAALFHWAHELQNSTPKKVSA